MSADLRARIELGSLRRNAIVMDIPRCVARVWKRTVVPLVGIARAPVWFYPRALTVNFLRARRLPFFVTVTVTSHVPPITSLPVPV